MADIFIGYTAADRDWAFWIAKELEIAAFDIVASPLLFQHRLRAAALPRLPIPCQSPAAHPHFGTQRFRGESCLLFGSGIFSSV
jgi:hypothetical protein